MNLGIREWPGSLFEYDIRHDRARYWAAFGLIVGLQFLLRLIIYAKFMVWISTASDISAQEMENILQPILLIFGFTGYLVIPMAVRRLHDLNQSGWWVVVFLVPTFLVFLFSTATDTPILTRTIEVTQISILDILLFGGLGLFQGTPGTNRFGRNPLDGPEPELTVDNIELY